MEKQKKAWSLGKQILFAVIVVILLLAAAVTLLWSNLSKEEEPEPAIFPSVYFEGEYRIGDGEWHTVVEGEHIPSTKGDVTLRGVFHMHFPDKNEYLGPVEPGLPIAFFMDHIGITVYENGESPYVMDNENPLYGISVCGEMWLAYSLRSEAGEPVELVIHNPHAFGNDTAIDELLSNLSVWVSSDHDREILSEGGLQRNSATVFIIVAFIFIGTALFS